MVTSFMETIAISKFKATCLSLLERVKNTGEPLLVTKKGSPIALVMPPPPLPKAKSSFGSMKDNTRITGNIIDPLPEEDWQVLRK